MSAIRHDASLGIRNSSNPGPDGRACPHRVRLAAVVSLVHEQVREHMPDEVALDLAVAALHRHFGGAAGSVKAVAKGDQAVVARALSFGQRPAPRRRVQGARTCPDLSSLPYRRMNSAIASPG